MSYLKRLAFFTLSEEDATEFTFFHLTGSKAEAIDAVVTVDEVDLETNRRVLDCYVTYQQTIEQAAALTGQTLSDFAVSTLVRTARSIIEEHDRTVLSHRDRDRFLALLDDADACPNEALAGAARKYKHPTG